MCSRSARTPSVPFRFANLPTLNTGDSIIFNFGSKPVGGVTLVNRLVNAAGSPRYQNMTDDETTLMRTNSGYVYTIPQSVSELLASDLSVPFYHALTLEYTDAQHIRHTAVAAYMTNAMTQLENPPLPSGGYYSDALGCTLKLPQEFRNAVSANINTTGPFLRKGYGQRDHDADRAAALRSQA